MYSEMYSYSVQGPDSGHAPCCDVRVPYDIDHRLVALSRITADSTMGMIVTIGTRKWINNRNGENHDFDLQLERASGRRG